MALGCPVIIQLFNFKKQRVIMVKNLRR